MTNSDNRTPVQYPNPKIMLIDLNEKTNQTFATFGYNVKEGSMGRPYKVKMSDSYIQVALDINLPKFNAKFYKG